MHLIPLFAVDPELAARETRVMHTLVPQGKLPVGSYGLLEFYCPDPACECRQAQRVQGILDTVPEGVLLLDVDHRVLLTNSAAERYLALLTGQEAILTHLALTHLGDRPLAELLAPPPLGLWHEVRAGPRTFRVQARPIKNGSEPERWVLALSDVTRNERSAPGSSSRNDWPPWGNWRPGSPTTLTTSWPASSWPSTCF